MNMFCEVFRTVSDRCDFFIGGGGGGGGMVLFCVV